MKLAFFPRQALLACALSFLSVQALAAGTGGPGVNAAGNQWNPSLSSLPTVSETADGFIIKTAEGKELRVPTGDAMADRFLTLWWKLHDPRNGYFSQRDVPFHSIETLIVEAPDYGHVTTSEGFSYWAWLEAMYGHYTGDFSMLRYVYDRIEKYAVPSYQPSAGQVNPSSPATYARENLLPEFYPSPLEGQVSVGFDPIASDLKAAYGDAIYGMHWLIDTENWYGFGEGKEPVFFNTFQRGAQESVWETIPHPSIEELKFGAPQQGYLSLFVRDPNGYKRQWRYTNAPDADARLVQATYWAKTFADAQGKKIDDLVGKASKMGDFLRYAMFDKYFKKLGCQAPSCQAGQGYDAAHYLLSWYYAWGGAHAGDYGAWAWRIGSSHAHFGYQNPFAAYVMSREASFAPKSARGATDWGQSLKRQIEFYSWLQSAEGAIAGGATNSWNGAYEAFPQGAATFYGMAYDPNPVYRDPGSNTWFGWQAWSMQRVAEYYYVSGDQSVAPLLTKWVNWVQSVTRLKDDGSFEIPVTIDWQGQPETWNPNAPAVNSNLRVTVVEYNQDVGISAAVAKTLMYYAAALQKQGVQATRAASASQTLARELIERVWNLSAGSKGLSLPEVRKDYNRFRDPVYVPDFYQGRMPKGELIDQDSTFLSLRQSYVNDPDFPKVDAYLNGGEAPVFRYHRFWAQVEAALAYAEYDRLFGK